VLAIVLPVVLGAACANPPLIRPSLKDAPTHERYSRALEEFGLDNVALGRDWLAAAARALAEPRPATLPFEETGYLAAGTPGAVGYRLDLRKGRRLSVVVTFESSQPSRFFVDLFEHRDDDEPRRVSGLEPGQTAFEYDVRRDGVYLLRLQPELLRGGRYVVSQRTLASLASPVAGFVVTQVSSGFGAPRDGGVRDHHGVDIFRPRGTPVLAAVDGSVRVDESPRGGRVIWLRDARGGRSIYYAHLHDWAVEHGAFVRTGDVIGHVGNTGNAQTTPPHLHFGVYERGPGDPVPYLQRDDPTPGSAQVPLDRLGAWIRVTRAGAVFTPTGTGPARGPEPGGSAVGPEPPARRTEGAARGPAARPSFLVGPEPLPRGTLARVIAAAGPHYRVELPDGRTGLVRGADVGPAATALATLRVAGPVLESPHPGSVVVASLPSAEPLPVRGYFEDFALVELKDNRVGWTLVNGQ
jgi:murein DD-endopeptidase MepM/ murein hydrolase activator NlpD